MESHSRRRLPLGTPVLYYQRAKQALLMKIFAPMAVGHRSVHGPIPYTVEVLDVYHTMSKLPAINQATSTKKGTGSVGAGGQLASSSLLL